MSYHDRIVKPKPGYSFPGTVAELIRKLLDLHFEVSVSGRYDPETKTYVGGGFTKDARPDLILVSGDEPLEIGFPLACYRRNGDVSIFSLPDELFSKQSAIAALDLALEEFLKIDRQPAQSTKQQSFFVYRAYIGELGKITLTRNLVRGGSRAYLDLQRAMDPRKLRGEETVILELKLPQGAA